MTRIDGARPRVTAVIPAHNMEAFLERTLASAIGQTYPDLDVIVIDDGSTDGTRAIAERIAATHERVRVESVANAGVAAARNLGTELARTPYVAYLDADDLWHPQKIERQVAALAAHGHDGEWAACYALSRFIGVGDEVLANGASVEARGDFFEKHLYRNHLGNGSCLLVRRDAALAVGGFDPAYAKRGLGGLEDYEFQLKLLQRYKMELVREFLVGYRVYAGQMSEDTVRMNRGRIATIEAVLANCDLPISEKRTVLAYARVIAAYRDGAAGNWPAGLALLVQSLAEGPRETLRWIVELAALRRRRKRDARRAPAPVRRQESSFPLFHELAPQDGVLPDDNVSSQPRIRLEAFRDPPAARPATGEGQAGRSDGDRSAPVA